jgi:pSer/pThr/pTyr-binding forkhead associated (FHA) protein
VDLRIEIKSEIEGQDKTWDLEFTQDLITIGRHSRNDVQIPDMQVSADHARIVVEGDSAYLVDLGSGTGTLVDGVEVGPSSKTLLNHSSEVRIAGYVLHIGRAEHQLDETTSERTAMVAMNMVREVLGSFAETPEPPYFEVINDEEEGNRLVIEEENREYRAGRDSAGDLVIRHWSISRKHLMIRRVGTSTTVSDMGSKNGCLLNGDRLEGSKQVKDGDVVSVGHTELKYHDPASSLLDSLDGTPTPISDLKDLGLDLDSLREERKPAEKTPPPAARSPEAPPAAASTSSKEPTGPVSAPMQRKTEESSFMDYLPLVAGIGLLLGAIAAAYFLFFRG